LKPATHSINSLVSRSFNRTIVELNPIFALA
jgi:hypothetical protein